MRRLLIGGKGYVGSALKAYLKPFVDVVDWNSGGMDYDTYKAFKGFDAIILLAGNSSVASCNDFYDTWNQNVVKFTNLLTRIGDTRLIYVSSASVYGGRYSPYLCCEDDRIQDPMNYYDWSKQMVENTAKMSGKRNLVGLRFGTVCGSSPNPRMDVIFNAMMLSAKSTGVIKESNPFSLRGVLGMKDLCRGIERVLEVPEASGIYNMSSFNTKICEVSGAVADYFPGTTIDPQKSDGNAYSFALSTDKFERTFDFAFKQTPGDIIEDLDKNVDWDKVMKNPELYKRGPRNVAKN